MIITITAQGMHSEGAGNYFASFDIMFWCTAEVEIRQKYILQSTTAQINET